MRNVSLEAIASYLVRLVRGSRSDLALLARREFSEVAVVVTLPVVAGRLAMRVGANSTASEPPEHTYILW